MAVPRRPFVGKELHDNRGGRQREARSQHQRARQVVVEHCGDRSDDRAGQHHLRAAKPEHATPHGPQPIERELEADREQQKDHAELGERAHAVEICDRGIGEPRHVVGEAGEAERPDREADHQEGEDGADP